MKTTAYLSLILLFFSFTGSVFTGSVLESKNAHALHATPQQRVLTRYKTRLVEATNKNDRAEIEQLHNRIIYKFEKLIRQSRFINEENRNELIHQITYAIHSSIGKRIPQLLLNILIIRAKNISTDSQQKQIHKTIINFETSIQEILEKETPENRYKLIDFLANYKSTLPRIISPNLGNWLTLFKKKILYNKYVVITLSAIITTIIWNKIIFNKAVPQKRPFSPFLFYVPSKTFKNIAGMHNEKKELQNIITIYNRPQRAYDFNVEPPCGILLAGKPGVGKTSLAESLAGQGKFTFIKLSASELRNKFVGEGAKNIRILFSLARALSPLHPVIIFIDEIDEIGQRIEGVTARSNEILSQLLAIMSDKQKMKNIIVIGATNRIDRLDPALKRSGRFDRIIWVGLPNESDRKKILKHYIEKIPKKNISEQEEKNIAEKTDNFTGAAIEALVKKAKFIAFQDNKAIEVTNEHFNKALEQLKKEEKLRNKSYKSVLF